MPYRTPGEEQFIRKANRESTFRDGLLAIYQSEDNGDSLVAVVQSLWSPIADWLFDQQLELFTANASFALHISGLEELGVERVEDIEAWLSQGSLCLMTTPPNAQTN